MQQNLFFDSFKLALHVSGDSFAHLQEQFGCIYSFLEQSTDSAVCCRPVIRCVTGRQQTAESVRSSRDSELHAYEILRILLLTITKICKINEC